MKHRTGFVSNSSSSSFVLAGIVLNTEAAIKFLGINPDSEDAMDELYEITDLDVICDDGKAYIGHCFVLDDGVFQDVTSIPLEDLGRLPKIKKLTDKGQPISLYIGTVAS
jgi:hypothetical protein